MQRLNLRSWSPLDMVVDLPELPVFQPTFREALPLHLQEPNVAVRSPARSNYSATLTDHSVILCRLQGL